MDCEMDQALLSAFLDDELGREDVRRVEQHIEDCETCQRLVDEHREFGLALRWVMEEQITPTTLEQTVLNQIRLIRQRAQALRVSLVCGICTCGGFLMAVAFLMSPFGVLVRPLFHLLMAASRESLHLTSFVDSLWAWVVSLCATLLAGCSLFGIRRLVRSQRNEVAA